MARHSEQKITATRSYGATVDLEATGPGDAFARLDALIEETGRTLVHPFDDPLVLAGAGTVGLEIEEDAPDADAIVVPVGGGGLISGIQVAVGASMRVIAVEPETSTALHTGLEHGEPTHVTPTSIADGLNAPFAGRLPLEITKNLERVLVSDEEIEEAFRFLYARAKLACEPAGAAAARPGSPARSKPSDRCSWSRAATSPGKPPLLSWPGNEDRHSSRVHPRHSALQLREHVHHAFHEARAARRDLLELPPVLYRQAEARRHGRPGGALPAAAEKAERAARASS